MARELKMIQVYAETHDKIKGQAWEARMSVRKYMEKLADDNDKKKPSK